MGWWVEKLNPHPFIFVSVSYQVTGRIERIVGPRCDAKKSSWSNFEAIFTRNEDNAKKIKES